MKKYMFALTSFVALAAYALTPATQWGDVSPTNTLAEVAADAGLATTNAVNAKLDKTGGTASGLTITPRLEIEDDDTWCTIRWSTHGWYLETDESADRIYLPTGDGTFALVSDIPGVRTLAYNLFPVDVGGGTRTIEMPAAQNTNNYVAVGWDIAISNDNTTCIGNMTKALGANSTAIGCNTEAQADNSIAIGAHTTVFGTQALAIGVQANAWGYGLAVGNATEAPCDGTAIGFQAKGTGPGTAIGAHAEATGGETVAIGHNAYSTAEHAVQIGQGTNNSNNTFKVFNRMLLDADGHVPLLTGKSYDLSDAADVTRALGDIITALGGTVE